MKKKVLLIIPLAIIILIAVSLWLAIRSSESEKGTFSFGYQPFGNNLPFFVAMQKGYFEEEGITVEPIRIISANVAANAVIQGDLVGNATVPLNIVLNIEEQQPGLLKIFMVKTTSKDKWSDYLLVQKDSPIMEIQELAGKKVGAYPGTAQQTLIQLILKNFIDPSSIVTVELPPTTQLQALESGQVDALLTYDERALIALKSGIARILAANPLCEYVVDPVYGFPYVLSTSFISENPNEARALRRAMYRAADFIESDEDEARQILMDWIGVESEIALEVRLWDQVKAEDINVGVLQRLADIYYEAGITQKKVDVTPLILLEKDLQ